MKEVAENLASIRNRVSRVASHPVTILGVTKKQPLERIKAAVSAGLTHLGNNYVQDGELLRAHFGSEVRWHFIGHIQSRKAKDLLDYDCVESIERIEIAKTLSDRAVSLKKKLSVLVEVNIGEEQTKSGVLPSRLGEFLKQLGELPGISVSGLMCLPPPLDPVQDRIPFFEKMAEFYHRYQTQYPFTTLSMGTSDDFEVAVKYGSNHVRLGTLLFGARSV